MYAKIYCDAGFSILELLVVIAIIAILASVGLQNWRTVLLRSELTSASQQLLAFLNEVQASANYGNKTQTIHWFSNAKNGHWCLAVTPENRPANCETSLYFIQPYVSVQLAGFSESSTLSFYGRREMAQTGTFQLKNSVGRIDLIVSTQGRIRYCSRNTYITGIPKC